MARLVGVDVGGTFTDLVLVDDARGEIVRAKVSTTLPDQAHGILGGLADVDDDVDATDAVIHGSTTATNAIIERGGASAGLIASEGFRDVIELGRRDRPEVYGFSGAFVPLIPRRHRIEVPERIAHDGEALVALDEDAVRAAGAKLLEAGVESVVVAFVHSYADPTHELRAAEILRELWPDPALVTTSAEIVPEIGEFERSATTAANAYLQPLMSRYLTRLVDSMGEHGYTAPVLIVQSNGGLMTAAEAGREAIVTVKSGPAAGVVAGAMTGRLAGYDDVITCDMGGTSFDVCLVTGGRAPVTTDWELGFRLPVRAPAVDLVAIGAGGGSIAHVNRGGVLNVGPRSAGATPGPACYGRGGTEATVSDANLVLGRLAAGQPMGTRGDLELDREAAWTAVTAVADRLGLGVEAAAEAILDVTASNMANAIRTVSVERGFDPRDFAMVIFGGAGPLHTCPLLRETGIGAAVVPPLPGIASAVGCVSAELRYEEVTTVTQTLDDGADATAIDEALASQDRRLEERLAASRVETERVATHREADVQYARQHHTLRVAIEEPITPAAVRGAFEAGYRRRFGHTLPGREVVMVNLRSVLEAAHAGVDLKSLWRSAVARGASADRAGDEREVVVGGETLTAPVIWRWSLDEGDVISGPAVIDQEDSTTFVEPGFTARADELGNLIVTEER